MLSALEKMLSNILRAPLFFIEEIYHKKYIIYQLTKRDFKNRYIGSTLGFLWTIIQPLVMMTILWFIFSFGFKVSLKSGVPFVAWLISGMVAWNFFADALNLTTDVFREYSFLVKKINFKISILPIVKILSSFILHLVNLVILIVILLITGIPISACWLQVIYYLGATLFLLLGIGWITSALNVFTKDVSYVVGILLQFGFWMTPIFWDLQMIPEKYRIFFKLNPMWYIVEGYRKAFIYQIPLWKESLMGTLYFWLISGMILLSAVFIFKRLKPHFADVL